MVFDRTLVLAADQDVTLEVVGEEPGLISADGRETGASGENGRPDRGGPEPGPRGLGRRNAAIPGADRRAARAGLSPDRSGLVEMYGQQQSLKSLSAAAQTEFVDRFAGAEHLARVRSFRDLRGRFLAARARLEELTALSRERERDMDLLAYQIREIESAGIRPGELPRLEAEEARLAYAERLLGYAALAEDVLS